MPGFHPIDPQIKAEILAKIKDEGMSVSVVAATYNVSLLS